jgi:hypothetical protein
MGKEVCTKVQIERIKVAPSTIASAAGETKLIIEFAIPGAPADAIDVKILEDSVHLTAPARDFEYVSALALGWPASIFTVDRISYRGRGENHEIKN